MLANNSKELPERSDHQKFAKQDDQDQDKQELAYHTRKKDETDMDTETFSRRSNSTKGKLSENWRKSQGLDVSRKPRRHTVAAVVHLSNTNNKERNSQPDLADTCKSSLPPVET